MRERKGQIKKTLAKMIKYNEGDYLNGFMYIREAEPRFYNGGMIRRAIFICPVCKKECTLSISNVKSKNTGSCCGRRENYKRGLLSIITHKMSYTKIYRTYRNIIQRCYNSNTKHYKDYGGRGIKMCERWLGKGGFENFYEDMGDSYYEKATIDRIDVNGNYCPKNCRWTSSYIQARNRRATWIIEWEGENFCAKDLCQKLGINYGTFYTRIKKYKWDIRRALLTPPRN